MGMLKRAIGPSAIHLCIDMQRLFDVGGPWPTPWMRRVLPVVIAIVEHSPRHTVFTRFIPPSTPEHSRGNWRAYFEKWAGVTRSAVAPKCLQLVSPLESFVPPASIVDKSVYSAFANGALHRRLQAKGIDTLIVTGSETDVCVLATVLSAVDIGYRIVVVKDGLCSSSDESHDALLALYAMRFDVQVELATAEEVLDCWRPQRQ